MLFVSATLGTLSVLLFAPFPAPSGDAGLPTLNDAARIDAVVREYGYDRPDAPGMSLIVIKEGKVLFKKAYGMADVEAKIPNTTSGPSIFI